MLCTYLGILPTAKVYSNDAGTYVATTFVATVAFLMCIGGLFFWLGNTIPIVNNYLGGACLLPLFGASLMNYLGLIPENLQNGCKVLMKTGFQDAYIALLLVGSVLVMDRKVLLNATARYLPTVIGSQVFALLFCVVGAYSANNSMVDVAVAMAFGVFGYGLRRTGFDPVPLLIAFVLGGVLEKTLRQALLIGYGSPAVFLERPIALALLVVRLVVVWRGLARLLFVARREVFRAERGRSKTYPAGSVCCGPAKSTFAERFLWPARAKADTLPVAMGSLSQLRDPFGSR